MKQLSSIAAIILLSLATGVTFGVVWSNQIHDAVANFFSKSSGSLISPFIETEEEKRPLLAYTIPNLTLYPYQASQIELVELIEETGEYHSYLFTFTTMGKKMSGEVIFPASYLEKPVVDAPPVILMLRGYVPPEIYKTGIGTHNAAKYFAEKGYITIAPDFFGYGQSEAEPTDTWEARFIKPINVIELLKSIQTNGLPTQPKIDALANSQVVRPTKIGVWAHSNGGQIALTMLEALGESIPTTLWAPVTAPFPYSVLFFGDEQEDEGKTQRAWVGLFEKKYDVFDFTLTKHLDRLNAPLQIHHGTADDAALYSWSTSFVEKVEAENERRKQATESGKTMPIDLNLFTYTGADHNLQPSAHWNQAIQRDLDFFRRFFQD